MSDVRAERRFAITEGIPTLYKFCPFGTEQRRAWVREILVDHRIYFARSSQLNDPYDLKPLLKLRRMATEREMREALRVEAEQHWARELPAPSAEHLARYRLRLATIELQQFERESVERAHQRLEQNYWIFSLATERGLVQMWDEYADARRSLCIHFRADVAQSPFAFAQRVIYQTERPLLFVPFGDTTESEIADLATLTKMAAAWAKEREYRLVRYPGVSYSEAGLNFKEHYGYFPSQSITGITVGTEMPDEHVRMVEEYANQHKPRLPVERPRHIDLSAVPISNRQG
jgi:hypothetical protein